MKEMKTITINGVTYTVTDPDAASIDDSKVGADAWSSKNTIDRLCPSFTESGYIVTCEPVEGYPLTVTSAETSSTFIRYGKNLLDMSAENVKKINWIGSNGTVSPNHWGVELILPPGTYTIKAAGSSGDYIYAQANDIYGTKYIKPFEKSPVAGGQPNPAQTATFAEWVRMYIYDALSPAHDTNYPKYGAMQVFNKYNIQLEVGNTATAYEPCNAEEFSFTSYEDGVSRATVPALPGVNTFINYVDGMTVTGRADPNAINRKTAERLAALEAAMINT